VGEKEENSGADAAPDNGHTEGRQGEAMNHIFWWRYVCHLNGNLHLDDFDAYCAGPRSMDCCTETALTA